MSYCNNISVLQEEALNGKIFPVTLFKPAVAKESHMASMRQITSGAVKDAVLTQSKDALRIRHFLWLSCFHLI